MSTQRVSAAADRAVKALRAAIDDPGTQRNRDAAEAIIGVRKQFKHEGLVDWTGRSPGYRDVIERVYREAGVPSDSGGGLQANLRYHLGNALREVAPQEDLVALGMAVQGPLGRVKEQRSRPRPQRVEVTGDPVKMAGLALDAVRTLRSMAVPDEAVERVQVTLRTLIDESLDTIAALH